MSSPIRPPVEITSDGTPMGTRVTIGGVTIPAVKATWTATATETAQCVLELPRVSLNTTVIDMVARYVDPEPGEPVFSWVCPCGGSVARCTPQSATAAFTDPANHATGCPHLPVVAARIRHHPRDTAPNAR